MKQKHSSTHNLVIMALFASLLCVCAYITIPLPTGQHITLQNFTALLIALLFPAGQATFIIIIWLLLGMAGIPVFVGGNAGISYLFSPLGGYTASFLLIAILCPFLRPKKYRRCTYSSLAILAALFIDICGALWVMLLNGISLKAAALLWILPYLPLDLIKAVVAAQLVPKFRRILNEANLS